MTRKLYNNQRRYMTRKLTAVPLQWRHLLVENLNDISFLWHVVYHAGDPWCNHQLGQGLTGDAPWAPPLSPSSGYLGDKLDPSKTDKQPKTHYLLFITEGQAYLNSRLYHFIPMATVINIIFFIWNYLIILISKKLIGR